MDEISRVVAKTAATISRDKFLRPLRALCITKIVSSLRFYVGKGVTSLHSYLLPKLCQEVFDCYVELFQPDYTWKIGMRQANGSLLWRKPSNSEMLEIASLFVNPGLKHFDTSVITFEIQELSDIDERKLFYKKLAEGATNLVSFEYKYDQFDMSEKSPLLLDYVCLCQMSHLITLKLDYHHGLTNEDLQVIGRSLPLLRRLDTCLERDVTIERGVKHLKQLKMLEFLVLTFEILIFDDIEPFYEDIVKFCLVQMPKLKITAYDLANGNFRDTTKSHYFSIFKKNNMEEPIELSLQHLVLKTDLPPANVNLPHVTHLYVISSLDAVEFCIGRSFPILKEIYVYNVTYEGVLRLLQRYGHQLSMLDLQNIKNECDLWKILSLCPHLENFFLRRSFVKDMMFINPSVCQLVAKMRKFSLGNPDFLRASSYCQAAGLLYLLMTSCPDLEELNLLVSITQSQVDEVTAGFAEGAILCTRKLKKLSLIILPEIAQEALVNFVKQVVSNCPKLSLIEVYRIDDSKRKFGPIIDLMQKFGRRNVIPL